MRQYESCIQIIIIRIKKLKIKKHKSQKGGWCVRGRAREERENFYFIFSFFHFSRRSMEIGLYIFFGAKGKVYLRIESYAWAPKS